VGGEASDELGGAGAEEAVEIGGPAQLGLDRLAATGEVFALTKAAGEVGIAAMEGLRFHYRGVPREDVPGGAIQILVAVFLVRNQQRLRAD
jgi:hypothetical protein